MQIIKTEKIIKRINKAVGKTQGVLVIGNWQENLLNLLKENENILMVIESDENNADLLTEHIPDNSFTRIICDYSYICKLKVDRKEIYKEFRRLLLPTGMLIVSANSIPGLMDKFFELSEKLFAKSKDVPMNIKNEISIRPIVLQDEIHENGFLMDGFYGYPGSHILMMAVIQNKEVSTLFNSKDQITEKNEQTLAKRMQ